MPTVKDTPSQRMLRPIKQAIMLEIHGIRFYEVAAQRCSNKTSREMFSALAKDEMRHRSELERQFRSILKRGRWSAPPALRHRDLRFKDPVIDASLKKDVEGAWFDSAALHIGVLLERRAVVFYKRQAERAKDSGMKSLFQWLAEWEQGHMNRLLALERTVKEEIWNSAGFWPMD